MIHSNKVYRVNLREVSQISGISPQTLKRLIDKGKIPASYTKADKPRIGLDDLELFCYHAYNDSRRKFLMYAYDSKSFYNRLMFYLYGIIED